MRCIFFLSLLTFVIHVAAVPLYIDNSRLFEGPSKPSSSIPFWQQNTAAAQHSDIRIYRNLIPRISPTVIGAGRDWFIGLVSGGLFTAALASLTASTGGSPFSRTWNAPVIPPAPQPSQPAPAVVPGTAQVGSSVANKGVSGKP